MPNRYQNEIVRIARWWAQRGCREVVRNGGSCIDDVHELYGARGGEAYCARLAWVIAEQAARAAGVRNPLPKTSGACDMLKKAVAAGLRVDKTPAVGAIGYHGSDPTASTGHITVVIGVSAVTMRTVEGNKKNRVAEWSYPLHLVKQRAQTQPCQRGIGWDFIHIEDVGGPTDDGATIGAPGVLVMAATLGAAAAGYAYMKRRGR